MFESKRYKKLAKAHLKHNRLILAFTTFLSALLWFVFLPTALSAHYGRSALLCVVFVAILGITANALAALFLSCTASSKEQRISFNNYLGALEDWQRGALAGILTAIRISLWALLFVIPAFTAAYKYSFVYFLLSEHRTLSPSRAVRLSAILTNGYKADLFLMHLSFLPLIAFSLVTFGIGFLWTVPYMAEAQAFAYLDIKNAALKRHILEAEDFGGK